MIGSFFTILAAGGWILKESYKELSAGVEADSRDRLMKKFVEEHTDLELESRLLNDIENPEKYNEVWSRIERFKRDNPFLIEREIRRIRGDKGDRLHGYVPRSEWEYVGSTRLPFRTPSGALRCKGLERSMTLEHNRIIALWFLMISYGKLSSGRAEQIARNIYIYKRER